MLLLLAGVVLGHAAALQCMGSPHPPLSLTRPGTATTVRTVTLASPHVALARPAPTPTMAAPAAPGLDAPSGYLPAHQLDWPALPRSAPDTARLDGLVLSGLPLTLRLYIDARGRVTAVEALTLADDDLAVLPALRAMFLATAYSPGRRLGRDVASTLDLALAVEPAAGNDLAPNGELLTVPSATQHAAAQ